MSHSASVSEERALRQGGVMMREVLKIDIERCCWDCPYHLSGGRSQARSLR